MRHSINLGPPLIVREIIAFMIIACIISGLSFGGSVRAAEPSAYARKAELDEIEKTLRSIEARLTKIEANLVESRDESDMKLRDVAASEHRVMTDQEVKRWARATVRHIQREMKIPVTTDAEFAATERTEPPCGWDAYNAVRRSSKKGDLTEAEYKFIRDNIPLGDGLRNLSTRELEAIDPSYRESTGNNFAVEDVIASSSRYRTPGRILPRKSSVIVVVSDSTAFDGKKRKPIKPQPLPADQKPAIIPKEVLAPKPTTSLPKGQACVIDANGNRVCSGGAALSRPFHRVRFLPRRR